MTISRRTLSLLAVLLLALLGFGASTAINLSDTNRTSGLLPVVRAGIGVATANAGTVFGVARTAAAGAPGFFTPTAYDFNATPYSLRWALISATGTGGTVYGDVDTGTCTGGFTQAVSTSTLPSYSQGATNTTNGNVCSQVGNLNYVVGRTLIYQSYYALSAVITRRDWMGFTDQTAATMGASADPAGNRAMFGFDTGLVETTWKCSTKDATTETRTNSAVTVDSAFHTFEIYETAGVNFKFYIDSVLVCTNSTHLPTSGTPMRYSNQTTCLTCTPTALNIKKSRNYVQANF